MKQKLIQCIYDNIARSFVRRITAKMNLLTTLLQNMIVCSVTERLTPDNVTMMVSPYPFGNCVSKSACCGFDETRDIRFHLFTRRNPKGSGILLPVNNVEKLAQILVLNAINPQTKTIIFVHGFTEKTLGEGGSTMRDAFLARGDYNVILVNWENLVAFPWYATAVQNTKLLGKYLAIFINDLNAAGIPIDNIHLVGFSLGAEAVGLAGKHLRDSKGNPRLKRITGLDPAYPLFSFRSNENKIYKTDAKFVDIIHTDAGIAGFPLNMGHADFYPNGGKHYQPGCEPKNFRTIREITTMVSCSHNRAWKYYAESVVRPDAFPATKCPRTNGVLPPCQYSIDAYMGYGVDPRARGKFYLRTEREPPYGRKLQW